AESPGKASGGQKRSNGSIDSALSISRQFTVSGIVTTGADEDNQIFASLQAAQKLAGLEGSVSAIAVSAIGSSGQIARLSQDIGAQSGSISAHPVRQLAESEGRLLGKLRLMILLVTVLILVGAALSVATTLTALVMERRQEIGTMKAIGAEDSHLLRQFLFELGGLGLAGGSLGYLIGLALAQAIGFSLFNSPVAPRFIVFIAVIGIALTVA